MIRRFELILWPLVVVGHIAIYFLEKGIEGTFLVAGIFTSIALSYAIGSVWFFQKKGHPKKLIAPALLAGFGIFALTLYIPFSILGGIKTHQGFYLVLFVINGVILLSWLIAFLIYRKHRSPLSPLILKTSAFMLFSGVILAFPMSHPLGSALKGFYQQESNFAERVKMEKALYESQQYSKNNDLENAYLQAKKAMESGYRWIEMDSNRLDLLTHRNYRLKETIPKEEAQAFTYEYLSVKGANHFQICDINEVILNYCRASLEWGDALIEMKKGREAYLVYYQTMVHFEALREDRCIPHSTYYINIFKAVLPCASWLKDSQGTLSADSFLRRFEGFHIFEKIPNRTPNPMFLLQMGSTYRSIGMQEKALDYFDKVIANASSYSKPIERTAMAVTCYEKAEQLMLDENYEHALNLLDTGQSFLVEDQNIYSSTLLRACIHFRQKEYEKAEEVAKECIDLAKSLHMQERASTAHKILADIYLDRENIELAMEQRKALVLMAETNPSISKNIVEIDIELLKLKGKLYDAYELMKNKRSLLYKSRLHYYNLSKIEYDLMLYEKAYSSFKTYMGTDTSYLAIDGVSKPLFAAILLNGNHQDYLAQQLIKQVEKKAAKWRSPNSWDISLLNTKGIVAMSKGQAKEAEANFSKAVLFQDSLDANDTKSLIRLKNNLAESQLRLHKYNLALKTLMESRNLVKTLQVQETLEAAKTYRLMAEGYEQLNEISNAQDLRRKALNTYAAILPENHPIFAALREASE